MAQKPSFSLLLATFCVFVNYSYTTFELSWLTDVAFCKFLFNNVVETYLCAENLPIRATVKRKRYRTLITITGLIFGTEKLTMFTRIQSIIVPVLGPVHTDTVSYCFEAFCAKTSKGNLICQTLPDRE